MSDPKLDYDPIDGFLNTDIFPTNPSTQAITRGLFQRFFTQVQTFINTTLIAWANATFAKTTDLQGIILGQIPDNTISVPKLTIDSIASLTQVIDSVTGTKYQVVITNGVPGLKEV